MPAPISSKDPILVLFNAAKSPQDLKQNIYAAARNPESGQAFSEAFENYARDFQALFDNSRLLREIKDDVRYIAESPPGQRCIPCDGLVNGIKEIAEHRLSSGSTERFQDNILFHPEQLSVIFANQGEAFAAGKEFEVLLNYANAGLVDIDFVVELQLVLLGIISGQPIEDIIADLVNRRLNSENNDIEKIVKEIKTTHQILDESKHDLSDKQPDKDAIQKALDELKHALSHKDRIQTSEQNRAWLKSEGLDLYRIDSYPNILLDLIAKMLDPKDLGALQVLSKTTRLADVANRERLRRINEMGLSFTDLGLGEAKYPFIVKYGKEMIRFKAGQLHESIDPWDFSLVRRSISLGDRELAQAIQNDLRTLNLDRVSGTDPQLALVFISLFRLVGLSGRLSPYTLAPPILLTCFALALMCLTPFVDYEYRDKIGKFFLFYFAFFLCFRVLLSIYEIATNSIQQLNDNLGNNLAQILKRMPNLEELDISNHPINPESVQALSSMRHLRALNIYKCGIPNESLQKLRGLLPNTEIRS